MTEPTLEEQIECVEREIGMREKVYPRWVKAVPQKMTQAKADQELARMRAVLATLQSLRWIPVAERMPDDEETVLMSLEDGEVWTGFHDGDDGWRYVPADPASGVRAWRAMPPGVAINNEPKGIS